ncbi:MAG: response regulator [Muriicola sp.]|nr:response regulator [Muriicola sp.]
MNKLQTSCIIDDDDIFVYGTKRIMKEVGFCDQVLVFSNGQDAITGLKELSASGEDFPSVIFLDLNMPIMDGWEFLEALIKFPDFNKEEVTIYIISSSVDPRDLVRVKDYSIVSKYILKPITPEDLKGVLANVA